MSKSKKILPSYFTALKIIFSELRYGRGYSTQEISGYTGFTKQRLNYWLEKLCEEGILKKQTRGQGHNGLRKESLLLDFGGYHKCCIFKRFWLGDKTNNSLDQDTGGQEAATYFGRMERAI